MATQHGKAAGGQSVTGHPMFPALVALWFGALFGLGSLAVRPALLEQVVLDLGIDTVIAAAAPPLGTTFRILMALSLAAFGAVLGAIVAGRLRRAPKSDASEAPRRTRDAHPDAPPRRPISAREEFENRDAVEVETLGPQPLPGRRRALAMSEDARPNDFHEYAPLPGGGNYGFDATARLDELVEKLGPAEDRFEEEPLELETEVDPPNLEEPTAGGAFAPPQDGARDSNDDLPFGRPSEIAEPFAGPVAEVEHQPEPTQVFTAPRSFAAPAKHAEIDVEPDEVPLQPASAAERLTGRAIGQLSIPELSERLAIALEQRRLRQAAAAAAARQAAALAASTPEPVGVERQPEPAPEPVQAFAVAAIPAALRPLDLAFEDEAEDEWPGPLPQRQFGLAAATAAEPIATSEPGDGEGSELDDEALADGYSSLLDLSRPAATRSEFVRIDDEPDDESAIEPVVTFPGQAARRAAMAPQPAAPPVEQPAQVQQAAPEQPMLRRFDAPATGGIPAQPTSLGAVSSLDREEADRALRAALATLQRMSGAA